MTETEKDRADGPSSSEREGSDEVRKDHSSVGETLNKRWSGEKTVLRLKTRE